MVTTTPQEEEREARRLAREQERLQREAERKQARKAGTYLADVIREELARPRAKDCRCGITPRMTRVELMALGAGCTAGDGYRAGYVCPVLDAIRRRTS